MSKEIQSILCFIGGCFSVLMVVIFGWKGVVVIGALVVCFYLADLFFLFIFLVGALLYMAYNKLFKGIGFDESMKIIDARIKN